MNRSFSILFFLALFGFVLSSCINEEDFSNDPKGNFRALWKILDERYCYFDEKGLDWDEVYREYNDKVTNDIDEYALFEILSDMLNELKDGHVNLVSSFNTSRYDEFYTDFDHNFNEDIQRDTYLKDDFNMSSGMKYKILEDNIGYVYYGSFTSPIGGGNLDEMLLHMSICDGIIIDVRDNGGGNLSNSTKLAARFTNEKVLTGYIKHKVGRGHLDFSDAVPIYIEPSNGVRWQKKVVVLTNNRCYSATNDFVNSMRCLPKVSIIGTKTGGGGGLPFTSELPNGWSVRFSASPHFDNQMNSIENGVNPDIKVEMTEEDKGRDIDTIIEVARSFLKKNI